MATSGLALSFESLCLWQHVRGCAFIPGPGEAFYFFSWKSPCFVIGFCLPKLGESGSRASGKPGCIRAAREGGPHVPRGYKDDWFWHPFWCLPVWGGLKGNETSEKRRLSIGWSEEALWTWRWDHPCCCHLRALGQNREDFSLTALASPVEMPICGDGIPQHGLTSLGPAEGQLPLAWLLMVVLWKESHVQSMGTCPLLQWVPGPPWTQKGLLPSTAVPAAPWGHRRKTS